MANLSQITRHLSFKFFVTLCLQKSVKRAFLQVSNNPFEKFVSLRLKKVRIIILAEITLCLNLNYKIMDCVVIALYDTCHFHVTLHFFIIGFLEDKPGVWNVGRNEGIIPHRLDQFVYCGVFINKKLQIVAMETHRNENLLA